MGRTIGTITWTIQGVPIVKIQGVTKVNFFWGCFFRIAQIDRVKGQIISTKSQDVKKTC
jgi:hypothetical protein